jgi:hypothetical protein
MIVIGHSVSKQATVFRLERRLRSLGQLWEDTVYTIGNAEVSHPEPGTLEVAKSRRQSKQVAVVPIIFPAVWCGVFLYALPWWCTWVRTGEDLGPLTVPFLLVLPMLFVAVYLMFLPAIFRHTRIAREGDAFGLCTGTGNDRAEWHARVSLR